MRRISCPYLGLKDDPTTTLNFPSPGNFCHQARPVASIKGTYQEKYCLTASHTACPLYQASGPMPLPASIPARPASFTGRQLLALLGVPAMVVAVAFFTFMLNSFNVQNWMNNPIPETGPGVVENNFGLLGAGSSLDRAPSSASTIDPTPLATINNCPLPENWVTYTVKPTDSLFRLSVIYGVSVEDLQRVNCMGDQTVILPGRVLYVPFIPTNTPMDTLLEPPQVLPTQTPPPNQGIPRPTNTSEPQPGATAQPTSTTQPTLPVQPTSTLPPLATPTLSLPTALPTSLPTIAPSPLPTIQPTQVPTTAPSPQPTAEPTAEPTQELPPLPTAVPTIEPTVELPPLPTIFIPPEPTQAPTALQPTEEIPVPTSEPPPQLTEAPLPLPTVESTSSPPTEAPPPAPTPEPTIDPLMIPIPSSTLILSTADIIDPVLLQINRIP